MAHFAKGGGPKDRGIFASNRHFHKRRKGRKVRKKLLSQKFVIFVSFVMEFVLAITRQESH